MSRGPLLPDTQTRAVMLVLGCANEQPESTSSRGKASPRGRNRTVGLALPVVPGIPWGSWNVHPWTRGPLHAANSSLSLPPGLCAAQRGAPVTNFLLPCHTGQQTSQASGDWNRVERTPCHWPSWSDLHWPDPAPRPQAPAELGTHATWPGLRDRRASALSPALSPGVKLMTCLKRDQLTRLELSESGRRE